MASEPKTTLLLVLAFNTLAIKKCLFLLSPFCSKLTPPLLDLIPPAFYNINHFLLPSLFHLLLVTITVITFSMSLRVLCVCML